VDISASDGEAPIEVTRSVPLDLLADWFAVTRPRKFLPFLLVLLNACLLSSGRLSWRHLLPACIFIIASCSFGMRINVWTDQELDRSRKPELYRSLVRSFAFQRLAMVVEVMISLVCLALLVRGRASSGATWLLLFSVLFSLYSFNFFIPGRGKACRFKVYWWGNLLSAGGGYFALWMAGLSSGPGRWNLEPRLLFAFFCASLEYALFLCECATDAEEERASALQTLPAKLGRFRTVLLAWSGSVLVAIWWFGFGHAPVVGFFGNWYAMSSVVVSSGFLYFARMARAPLVWDRFVDLSFWIIRLGGLTILLFEGGA
jgi:4-hydroxybenzoate polyprenyltransferase